MVNNKSLAKKESIRSKKIRNAANGELCTLNSPVCTYNNKSTVFCHLNEEFAGKGLGLKADDIGGFFGCGPCHTYYDSGRLEEKYYYLLRAVLRTMRRLIEKGIMIIG